MMGLLQLPWGEKERCSKKQRLLGDGGRVEVTPETLNVWSLSIIKGVACCQSAKMLSTNASCQGTVWKIKHLKTIIHFYLSSWPAFLCITLQVKKKKSVSPCP